MSLSLVATEQNLESIVSELLVQPISQPAFVLNVVPAELNDRAVGPRGVSNVIIRFNRIEYDNSTSSNPTMSCRPQVNTVYWTVIVNTNSVRYWRDNYAIAQAIIGKLRSACSVLVMDNLTPVSVQSNVRIESFSFDNYDETKSCHKSRIDFSIKYTDIYQTCNQV